MFGVPMPKLPKDVQDDMKESVLILKQKSSVETFKAVHQKVEDGDAEKKSVRGACLRELREFLKEHDPRDGFAGLRRISDFGGGAIWTAISDDDEVKANLDARARLRELEDSSDMSALQDQLLQRNTDAKEIKDLESENLRQKEVNKALKSENLRQKEVMIKGLQEAKVGSEHSQAAQPAPVHQTKCSFCCTIS